MMTIHQNDHSYLSTEQMEEIRHGLEHGLMDYDIAYATLVPEQVINDIRCKRIYQELTEDLDYPTITSMQTIIDHPALYIEEIYEYCYIVDEEIVGMYAKNLNQPFDLILKQFYYNIDGRYFNHHLQNYITEHLRLPPRW